MTKVTAEKILLGCGTISVGGVAIGLTRGGSKFVVERAYRNIEADCDKGPVEGRVVIDSEVPKLTVNGLELFAIEEIKGYWPALETTTTGATYDEVTGTLTIAAGDYVDVAFSGYTKDGKTVVIQVDNCLNLSNIELGLEEKSEVVPSLEFTGHYAEATRTTPPWRMRLGKTAVHTVTFTVDDGAAAVAGADVIFYGRTVQTDVDGVAAFANIPEGSNMPFTIRAGGFSDYLGSVTVDDDEAVAPSLTEI